MKKMNELKIFLPMRAGSQRVKNKNLRPFAGFKHGLFELKIKQLIKANIGEIIVSTNQDEIINYIDQSGFTNVRIDIRPENLCTNQTTTDDLIEYVSTLFDNKTILWTHVTSPFLDELFYKSAINTFRNCTKEKDSLVSVNKIQSFLWDDNGPINYNRSDVKWPWTQSINPIFEINSGVFIADSSVYKQMNDRIGENPVLFEVNTLQGIDIDWEEDFITAEKIYKALYK